MIVTLHTTGHHCRHETPTHSSAGWAAGEKYRVTANYAVIYDAEQPTEELRRMNRGNRFEVIGKTGNRLVLNHKGKKGLMAPYHCEPVPEPALAAQTASAQPQESTSPATATATQDADGQPKPKNYFRWLDTFLNAIRSDNSATEVPHVVAYILAFLCSWA